MEKQEELEVFEAFESLVEDVYARPRWRLRRRRQPRAAEPKREAEGRQQG